MHTQETAPVAGAGSTTSRVPASEITLIELIEAYMAHYAGRDRNVAERLLWWAARLGNRPVVSITDDDVFHALEDCANSPARVFAGFDAEGNRIFRSKGKKKSPGTVNRHQAALGGLITWGIKKRRLPRDYLNPTRRVERRPENNSRVRFLDDGERERLLSACRASKWPKLYALVLLALTTGARKGELLGLRWQDLDLRRGLAYVATTKNNEPKVLPLVPAAVEALRAVRDGAPAQLIFASRIRPELPYTFEQPWREALRAAHIRGFRFHDLRHTCASYLAQQGASLLEIADVLGHKQLAMTKRYSHLTVGTKASLVNRVLGGIR